MAERRMFAKTIIRSDAFLEMPYSAQCLYFQLNSESDDEGFVNNPKSVMRVVRCNEDDMRVLIVKKFIIPFDTGVIVIKHWRIHNYIRGDRIHETKYQYEKSLLELDENQSYRLTDGCQPNVSQLTDSCHTEVRLGKVSIGKDKNTMLGDENTPSPNLPVIRLTLNDKSEFPIYQTQIDEWSNLYPSVNVFQQVRNMKGWLDANPTKRKTKSGILRFINGWLAKEQDKGGTEKHQSNQSPKETAYEKAKRLADEQLREEGVVLE